MKILKAFTGKANEKPSPASLIHENAMLRDELVHEREAREVMEAHCANLEAQLAKLKESTAAL